MKLRMFVTFLCLLASSACIPSLYPLYDPEDLEFYPELLGTWVGSDRSGLDIWVLEGDSADNLVLTLHEKGKVSTFGAKTFQLGGRHFIDIYPKADLASEGFMFLHFIPTHTFYRIDFDQDQVSLRSPDLGWLTEMAETGGLSIQIANPRDEWFVITSPTENLREVFREIACEDNAFSEEEVLYRQ